MKKFKITAILALGLHAAHAQNDHSLDRVYTANQVSNTVSVVDPVHNTFLGEIKLGKPYPNVLSPIYRGESLVHGLRYSPSAKMLAVVSIGSNSVTLISTETNKVLRTIYIGRSPHEPTFTPDGKQIWTSVRGESHVSVIDVASQKEIRKVSVADGPGMISFSPDGKTAYVCSSFTAELDIVNTGDYKITKKIPVVSPFSPNIFTNRDGNWVAMTHKDVGKVSIIDAKRQVVHKVFNTGPITNHVTFATVKGRELMFVTVGGENKVRVYDLAQDFKQIDSLMVGNLPHGIWPSKDGSKLYVGLEYDDQVQAVDLFSMKVLEPVKIGQSPQALVYADHAVSNPKNALNLMPLNDSASTQIIILTGKVDGHMASAKLAVRPIGLADLIEQIITGLVPGKSYTLAFTNSSASPYKPDYEINSFTADANGKYVGQSTGLVKSTDGHAGAGDYKHLVLLDNATNQVVLIK